MTNDTDDFEQEWQDLDAKVILAQILAELQQIRMLLSDPDSSATSDSDGETMYRCTKCPGDTQVSKSDRERHARSEHNAPPGMVESLFTEVEG
jgi:hypothetical protein